MHHTGHIASSRPIEFWLTVFPATGIFIAGWGCILLRTINRLCHDVAQPETRAAWLDNAASILMVSTTHYNSPHLHRHRYVRRFAVVYLLGTGCMLVLALISQILGLSDALFTDFAIGLLVLSAAATPLALLGGQLHSNRDQVDARRPALRFALAHYARHRHDSQ